MKQKPTLIVLTPVMNEAWILPAFLKATSLWADYIIIADQMSTDGTRELYARYNELKSEVVNELKNKCKLIVIDNPRKEMHQAATRRLLLEEAKKIEGDKILFALDADEFLSGNFTDTDGWKTIINSEPGDVFEFRWMNISADIKKYSTDQPFYWAAHFDNDMFDGAFPDNFIHEWRLPWPQKVNHEYTIEDIRFIHFARVNINRQKNKERFYQIAQTAALGEYSGISFFRSYYTYTDNVLYDTPQDIDAYYREHGVDICGLLNLDDEGKHYTESVLRCIEKKGVRFFRKLDVWDAVFFNRTKLQDPQRTIDKIIHWYLRKTVKYANTLFIRGVDKLLKLWY